MPRDAPIIITCWSSGASIEFYISDKTKQEVLGIGSPLDLHQYYWSNKYVKPLKEGDNAYYIVPSEDFYFRTALLVKKSFKSYEVPLVITQYRSGQVCKYIYVFRMTGYLRNHDQ